MRLTVLHKQTPQHQRVSDQYPCKGLADLRQGRVIGLDLKVPWTILKLMEGIQTSLIHGGDLPSMSYLIIIVLFRYS